MKRRTALVVLAGMVGLAGPAAADETTFCNFFITTLPYTIATQGHYCFNKNLSTAITTGNAITINADFVVLDLNNFKLGGGAAGLGTTAVGVFALNRSNITVRNGNIRGFDAGISISGSPSANHVIENNVLDGNTTSGMRVAGDALVIRNNTVSNTGGSTLSGGYAIGVYSYANSSYTINSVRDNLVSNTFSATGTGYIVGMDVSDSALDHNVIQMNGSTTGTNRCMHAHSWLRDNICLGHTAGNGFFHNNALIGHNYEDPPD